MVNSPLFNYHEDHNYCRNPLPSEVDRPWCYTRASDFKFGFCDIPICDCRNSTTDHSYSGKKNVTKTGNECIHWRNAPAHTPHKKKITVEHLQKILTMLMVLGVILIILEAVKHVMYPYVMVSYFTKNEIDIKCYYINCKLYRTQSNQSNA
ncbi:PLG [Mytilus edulis]|uniref:PLG n=1 Tax=Mytilus edulis TaxID=6550 RepID=A0A8S3TB37_MYTED|nr:PLG [Mytilus edulis]